MAATFDIQTNLSCHLVAATLGGFFELDDVAAFSRAMHAAYGGMRRASGPPLVLIDCAQIQIQSQVVVTAFQTLAQEPALRSRRLALVVGMSLAQGQVHRVCPEDREDHGYFRDRASAEAWLLTPPVNAARTASRYHRAPASPRSDDRGYTDPNGA